MLGKTIAGSTGFALIMLGILLIKTAPSSAGPIGILTVFVLMYMSALGLLTFLLYGTSIAISKVGIMIARRSLIETFSLRKAYYYASVVALAPVMLVAMQSVNEVGFYQVALIALFVVIAWLYITKRTS